MLVKKDLSDKNKSIYICNMCGEKMNGSEGTKIFEINNKTNKQNKLYDLCPHCYQLIRKSVIKYKNKKINK